MIYRNCLKRLFDLLISSLSLIVVLPLIVFTYCYNFIAGNETWFVQKRSGKNGIPFNVIKFKTMTDLRDLNGNLLPDNVRTTSLGRFYRHFSIDELPQILNVFLGQMSIVGPRPLLIKYLPLYSNDQLKRHNVKPGITGWAQVNGRNAISWQEKFEYDVWYVDHVSFCMDIKIILLTIKKVILREGINAAEGITMEEFKGNEGTEA